MLVAHPNDRQYGHLGLEMGMSLAHARKQGADVCFIRPSTPLGSALFELESPQVRVLRPAIIVQELLRTLISCRKVADRVGGWSAELLEQIELAFVREVAPYVADPKMPPQVRQRLRQARQRLRASLQKAARERRESEPYYKRRLIREPVPVRLPPAASEDAARQARASGIDPGAPIVCIHAREPGYKRGSELHDTKPDSRDDRTRNARIESYVAAADHLVRAGFQVVCLGDPTMTPLQHPGVVDLATSPQRTNLLEVWCLLRCAFIICGESAFGSVIYLTNTPMLLVNATEPFAAYPVRGPGLFVPKMVLDKRDGRRLTTLDLLTLDYHRQFRDTRRYVYADNSPDEIRDAAQEMLEWVNGRWTESAAQRSYHAAAVAAAEKLWLRSAYVRKWGLHEGFLGDGRIAKVALHTQ